MSARKVIRVPSEVNAKQKWEKLQVKDGFIILGSIGIGFIISLILPLPQIIRIIFVASFPVMLYFLLLPNAEVPQKKNYQVMLTVLRKRHVVYRRASREELEERRKA
ncbi:hypothetical protein [Listeria seeligeri]|uniref:Uncharacterized protein n=1 Tax=Listeria seeligeri TaxID=1640 RepID=A0A7T0Q8D5_LISSE|nr:hypothetical protein [Listeria seeligeri]MBC1917054.1 hypothetical protein [Listeria seeligeri]MBC1990387.1 hypothetical protein [Listeria seeligeri]MBF2375200.1 hypothetical protein [Listeria seeligeri]QPL19409.1 hypothetical protein pLIS400371c [Listeria seeligeri]UCK61871.1 hypothetical protein pLIS51_00331c [Listeria seeligeri]